ncbi:unnamed protein product [Didymodactylos carnosus]|uniref:Phosphoserine phosphatase n=1 Tax=Didymodactylos carnosus TaxID=1234261 RepID=A0A814SG99_9BILA|nr:unnamed protein product [Didymodactylos carnosus]CAF1147041.1 unnamed protein product [Didymodactylos carnosus]CAF3841364.1 unnamed protein product [Didymodactylos carnosus]CAF3910610.1 unnamed protein product [Didymodactylos carnosus]
MTKGLVQTASNTDQHHQQNGTTLSPQQIINVSDQEHTRQLWLKADCVCFDVDSTVCKEEAIDELAKFQNVGHTVEQITLSAMGGNMSFRHALKLRLNVIQPTSQRLSEFLLKHPPQLTDGIVELIQLLHERHVPVYLITGGFHAIVDPIAKRLHIPLQKVFANRILFDDENDGNYIGFDENEFTSDTGGKGLVIEHLKRTKGYERLIMIGDGATDMEACPPADGFIGFGGNIIRDKVRDNSPWFVTSFYQLIDELRNNSIENIPQNRIRIKN